MQIEPQKLDQNLLEKSHGSLFTEENREKGTSMKGLPRDQLTKKKEEKTERLMVLDLSDDSLSGQILEMFPTQGS